MKLKPYQKHMLISYLNRERFKTSFYSSIDLDSIKTFKKSEQTCLSNLLTFCILSINLASWLSKFWTSRTSYLSSLNSHTQPKRSFRQNLISPIMTTFELEQSKQRLFFKTWSLLLFISESLKMVLMNCLTLLLRSTRILKNKTNLTANFW